MPHLIARVLINFFSIKGGYLSEGGTHMGDPYLFKWVLGIANKMKDKK